MSTTIYNGFKLVRGVKSLDKAFYMMQDIRAAAQGVASYEASRMLAMDACAIYDDAAISGVQVGKSALAAAYDAIRDDLEATAKTREKSYYDLEFGLALGITADKTVIGIAYGTNVALRNVLMRHPDVAEYGYWDSTDAPDGITRKEWAKRRGHWNEVLPDGIPAQEMFNISFIPEYTMQYPEKEDVAKQIVTFEKRLHRVVEKSTMAKAIEELQLDTPAKVIHYRMSGSDYDTRLETEKVLMASKLKQDLTIEDLLEKI